MAVRELIRITRYNQHAATLFFECSRGRPSSTPPPGGKKEVSLHGRTFNGNCRHGLPTRPGDNRRNQPPIENIGREIHFRKTGLLSWCFSGFLLIAARIAAAISSSGRPCRNGSRKSVSSVEKRQVRSFPSEVNRSRLQLGQKCSDTGLIIPIFPGAPSNL